MNNFVKLIKIARMRFNLEFHLSNINKIIAMESTDNIQKRINNIMSISKISQIKLGKHYKTLEDLQKYRTREFIKIQQKALDNGDINKIDLLTYEQVLQHFTAEIFLSRKTY